MMHNIRHNEKPMAEIFSEAKAEIVEFVQTRLKLLKEEIREKNARFKIAIPLFAVALILIGTAYLLFTAAVVALVAGLFEGSEFRWVYGLGIVGVAWAIIALVTGYVAKRELEPRTLMPKRTLAVLRADKDWFQKEAKSEL